jgi:hypothetical protein
MSLSLQQRTRVLAALREAGEQCNKVSDHNLNYGGCGVFALAVIEALAAHGIKARAWHWTYSAYASRTMANQGNGVNMRHVIVRIGGVFLDSVRVSDTRESWAHFRGEPFVPVRTSVLATRVSKARYWNDTFNRSNIPAVRAIVRAAVDESLAAIAA